MTKQLSDVERMLWDAARRLIGERKYNEAIDILDRLLVEDRDTPKIYAHRGYALYQLEDYAKAIRDFDIAISAVPTAVNTLFLRGRSLEELERFDDAIADYRRVITLKPETADAHAQLGYCLEMLGRFDEAKAAYDEALKHDPEESLALCGLRELAAKGPRQGA